MNEGIFRKNSLDKIYSPEQIDDYIKTINPSIWGVFAAAAVIIVGALIWGIFGTIDITVGGVAVCENGNAILYISEKDTDKISKSAEVRIGEQTCNLYDISDVPVPADDVLSPYARHAANFSDDEWVYTAKVDCSPEKGVHKAKIIINSVPPVSLLID